MVDLLISEKNDIGSLSEGRELLGFLAHPHAPLFLFPPSLSIYPGCKLGTRYLDVNETHSFKMLIVQSREREPVMRPIEHHRTGA